MTGRIKTINETRKKEKNRKIKKVKKTKRSGLHWSEMDHFNKIKEGLIDTEEKAKLYKEYLFHIIESSQKSTVFKLCDKCAHWAPKNRVGLGLSHNTDSWFNLSDVFGSGLSRMDKMYYFEHHFLKNYQQLLVAKGFASANNDGVINFRPFLMSLVCRATRETVLERVGNHNKVEKIGDQDACRESEGPAGRMNDEAVSMSEANFQNDDRDNDDEVVIGQDNIETDHQIFAEKIRGVSCMNKMGGLAAKLDELCLKIDQFDVKLNGWQTSVDNKFEDLNCKLDKIVGKQEFPTKAKCEETSVVSDLKAIKALKENLRAVEGEKKARDGLVDEQIM